MSRDFDRRVVLRFRGSAMTSDAGFWRIASVDDALALIAIGWRDIRGCARHES
jgi:hypothetical protein